MSDFPLSEEIESVLGRLHREKATDRGQREEVEKRRRFYRAFLEGDRESSSDEEDSNSEQQVVSETTDSGQTSQDVQLSSPLMKILEPVAPAPMMRQQLLEWLENNGGNLPTDVVVGPHEVSNLLSFLLESEEPLPESFFGGLSEKVLVPSVARLEDEEDLTQQLAPKLKRLLLIPERIRATSLRLVSPLLLKSTTTPSLLLLSLDLLEATLRLLPGRDDADVRAELTRAFLRTFGGDHSSSSHPPTIPPEALGALEVMAAAVAEDGDLLPELLSCLSRSAPTLGSNDKFVKILSDAARY